MTTTNTPTTRVPWAVAGALLVDNFSYGLLIPLLAPWAVRLGVSEHDAGRVFGAYGIGVLLTVLLCPRVATGLSGRALLLGSVTTVAWASVALAFVHNPWAALVLRFVLGGASGVSWVVGPSVVMAAVVRERRGAAMGITMAGSGLGTLLGPAIGGVLADALGFEAPFVVVSVCAAAVAWVVWRVVPTTGLPGERDATATLLRDRHTQLTFALVCAGMGSVALLQPTLPPYLSHTFALGPLGTGLLFSTALVAYALASPWAGRVSDRIGARRACWLGLVGCAVSLPLVGVATSMVAMACALACVGVAVGLLLTPCMPLFAEHADRLVPGSFLTAYLFYNVAVAVGLLVGPYLGVELTTRMGMTTSLCALGAASALWALLAFGALWRVGAAKSAAH
jgi:predicted MFS family arabinose efflux permease